MTALQFDAARSRRYRIVAASLLLVTALALLLPGVALEAIARSIAKIWPFADSGLVASKGALDKLVHAGLFAASGFALVGAWAGGAKQLFAIFGMLLVYGGLTEAAQMIIPGRSGSVADFAADAVGSGIGVVAGWYWNQNLKLIARQS